MIKFNSFKLRFCRCEAKKGIKPTIAEFLRTFEQGYNFRGTYNFQTGKK